MQRFRFFAGAAVLAVASCATRQGEPRNLGALKAEVRAYVDSGRYQREIAAIAVQANAWLTERAARRKPAERLAAVFDLDETLLSNWPLMQGEDLGASDAEWEAWLNRAEAPPLEPVREVYRTARRLGVEIFFLTGRREHLRASTARNLRAIDCGDCVALILKPESWQGTTAAFKTAERARLVAEGHVIIANLGDQKSDLVGGYAERAFKLPDPFYFTP